MTTNQQDFYQLNLAYLHAARELARIDPQEAVLRFGLTRDVVDALINAVLTTCNEWRPHHSCCFNQGVTKAN